MEALAPSIDTKMPLSPPPGSTPAKLKHAAQELEAVFIQQLVNAMDKTVDRSESLFSGGSAEETFRGMLNQHVSLSMATRAGGSGFGLAENIYRQMAANLTPEASATEASPPQEPKP